MGAMPLDQATGALQDTAALPSIGAVSPQAVVRCARDALIAGLDSPSLRILAGLTRAEADCHVLDILPAARPNSGWTSTPATAAAARKPPHGPWPPRLCPGR
jgi:hypothetical protein